MNKSPTASTTAYGVDLDVTARSLAMLIGAVLAEAEHRHPGFTDGVKARLPAEGEGLLAEAAHDALLAGGVRVRHG